MKAKITLVCLILAGCSNKVDFITPEQYIKAREYCHNIGMGAAGWSSYEGFGTFAKAEKVYCVAEGTGAYEVPRDKYK